MTIDQVIVFALGVLALAAAGRMAARFLMGCHQADRAWAAARYSKLPDIGTVDRLTILPLIDWYTAHDGLLGEPGVAYLIRADDTTILFDVGYNARKEHPSPLLRNMQSLGVHAEDVNSIVISHLHSDHVGGTDCLRERTFALSGEPIRLDGVTTFVPEPMSHPTAHVEVVEGPRAIAPGVASTGAIARQLFFLGWTPEQSLAINVKDKGIVLVIGCGHSTVQRIVERAEMLFDAPIYGVIGGLHLPVTASRTAVFGLPMQRIAHSWSPFRRMTAATGLSMRLGRHSPAPTRTCWLDRESS